MVHRSAPGSDEASENPWVATCSSLMPRLKSFSTESIPRSFGCCSGWEVFPALSVTLMVGVLMSTKLAHSLLSDDMAMRLESKSGLK